MGERRDGNRADGEPSIAALALLSGFARALPERGLHPAAADGPCPMRSLGELAISPQVCAAVAVAP